MGKRLLLALFTISTLLLILGSALAKSGEIERLSVKVHRQVLSVLSTLSDEDEIRVLVRYPSKPGQRDLDEIVRRKGTIHRTFSRVATVAVKIKKIDLPLLDEDPESSSIEIDLPVKKSLDSSVPAIHADWVRKELGVTGKNIKVAVIDTGVDKGHPCLRGSVVKEKDFTGEGSDDQNGHGTHVASTISCVDKVYEGVAPDALIVNLKALNRQGTGYASDIMAAIEEAIVEKVDVISMSLGGEVSSCDGHDAFSEEVTNAVNAGIPVVVAAGNSGPKSGTINAPGCAEAPITVAACSDAGTIASFSSRGPTADGRSKPDICAPGVNITAADGLTEGFITFSGTSMATPHVAGIIALLKEAKPGLTPGEIKTLLISHTASKTAHENSTGKGFVDAYSLIAEVKGVKGGANMRIPRESTNKPKKKSSKNSKKHLTHLIFE